MLNWDTTTTILQDGVNQWAVDNGWSVTQVTDGASFVAELNGAFIYEVVVYENPCCVPTAGEIDSMANFISTGGKMICSYWDLDADPFLQSRLGISGAIDITTPEDVFAWDSSHPIWDGPFTVTGPLTPPGPDLWLDNGERLSVAPGATPVGGFVGASVTAGEAAIVVGNGGSTIVHGFTADDMDIDVTELVYNEMQFLAGAAPPMGPMFVRGDCNNDGGFDISDAVFLLSALFVPGSPSPSCADAADSNDDGSVDISDSVYKLSALFVPGSPPPAAPHPDCGEDPTDDPPGSGNDLGCDSFASCP